MGLAGEKVELKCVRMDYGMVDANGWCNVEDVKYIDCLSKSSLEYLYNVAAKCNALAKHLSKRSGHSHHITPNIEPRDSEREIIS